MREPWKRAATLSLAACSLPIIPFIVGCDSNVEKVDKTASADMNQASDTLTSGKPDAADKAIAAMQKVQTKSASPTVQVEASMLLAQAQVAAADRIINGSADELGIVQHQSQIAHLLSLIGTLGAQMDINNAHIAGFKALDPNGARKAITDATTAAQKGENGAWVAGTAPIPSLDGLKQKEQDLTKQLADLKSQSDDLTAKRNDARQNAAKFDQQADSTTGKDSVGFYIQASNLRRESSDDDAKIQQLTAQMVPLQQDLATVQLQEKSIGDILAAYGNDTQQVENGWANLQKSIATATDLSKGLLDGAGAAPDASAAAPAPATAPSADASSSGATAPTTAPSSIEVTPRNLAALSAELDKQFKETQALRDKAVELLNNAAKNFDTARSTAKTYVATLNQKISSPDNAKLPEKHAWMELAALDAAARFDLRLASVQNRLGLLYTNALADLAHRNQLATLLAPVLQKSGLTPPASVAAALPAPGAVPPDVDSQLKQIAGDLISDSPPFEKDADALAALATAQAASPAALQAIAATQADLAYKWNGKLLGGITQGSASGDMGSYYQNLAHAALMAGDYGYAQLAALEGKQQVADGSLKDSLAERDALVDANARNLIPTMLPADLAFKVQAVAPTSAPSTPPAGTPPTGTTAPAETPATMPASAGANSADQQAVLQVAAEFFNDLGTGQADKSGALAVADPQFAGILPTMADAMGSVTSFKNSVKAKFGDAGNGVAAQYPDPKPDLTTAQVTITDTKAKITTPANPDVLDLTKSDAGWKVDKFTDAGMQALQQVKLIADVLKAVIPDIDGGKYATVDDLSKDLAARLQAAGLTLPTTAPTGATPPGPGTPPATPPADSGTPPATPPAGGATTPPAGGATTPPAGGATTPPAGGATTPPAQ